MIMLNKSNLADMYTEEIMSEVRYLLQNNYYPDQFEYIINDLMIEFVDDVIDKWNPSYK